MLAAGGPETFGNRDDGQVETAGVQSPRAGLFVEPAPAGRELAVERLLERFGICGCNRQNIDGDQAGKQQVS